MERRIGMNHPRSLLRAATILVILGLFATACSGSDDPVGGADGNGTSEQNDQGSGGQNDPSDSGDSGGSGGSEGDGGDASGVTADEGGDVVTVSIEGPGDSAETEITITLDDAVPGDDVGVDRETTVAGDTLSTGDVEALLGRLPDLDAEADDQVEFNRPPDTRPPPVPGGRVEQAFPPDADAPPTEVTDPGPLEVLRFQPEGDVDVAPFISVTFNQPMIALGTVSQVEEAAVPITITPDMPGRWIWLGTRTVRFEYEPGAIDRIPASTDYTVSVDAGAESVNGTTLDDGLSFTFSTPTPTVQQVTGLSSSMATEPLIFVRFDQRVDPDAILEVTTLSADGRRVEARIASDEEIEEDDSIRRATESALAERWVVLRPTEPLPTDSAISLEIGPGIASLEGPKRSDQRFSYSGRTYGPFRIVSTRCGWDDLCEPGQQWRIEMSNPIDTEAFRGDQVAVDPAVPSMRVGVSWNEVTIQGATKGRTTYEVTLSADLTDIYGQRLGEDLTRTIEVDDARPALFHPGRGLVTLDPIVDDGRLYVTSINNEQLRVTSWSVDPLEDWSEYQRNSWDILFGRTQPSWSRTDERLVDAGGVTNEFAETGIDLTSDLAATGHAVVMVEPRDRDPDDWRNEGFILWVQRTHLGLDAYADNQIAVMRVTDLRTGEPIENANVSIVGGGTTTTGADGLGEADLGRDAGGAWVEADDQIALIGDFWAETWTRNDQVRWYVIDDRGLYKQGETVSIKGWIRESDAEIPSALSLPDGGTVQWRAQDGFGNEIGSGTAELSALGGFDFELDLPVDMTSGFAGINLSTDAFAGSDRANWWHEFRVEAFRRPDFEVSTQVTTDEPRFIGDTVTVEAEAEYFAGGTLGGSQVEWQVSGRPTSYSPPGWPEYTFGIWVPWWYGGFEFDDFGGGFGGGFGGNQVFESWSATTDAAGVHALAVTVDLDGKPRPVTIDASATVFDVNRQPISSSAATLLHPSDVYVGMRGERTFIQADQPMHIELVAADIDGALVAGTDLTVTSTRLEWRFEGGQWTEVPVVDEVCDTTSGDEPVVCTFRPSEGGRYRVTATLTDDQGRENLSELTRWVAGGERPQSRRVDLEELTLVPDGESWQPGETAEVLVQAPFNDAHGLVVVTRNGIDRTETFDFDEFGTAIVRIDITEDDIPGIGLQFEAVGTAPRGSSGAGADAVARPAYAAASLTLSVPADARTLTVDVAPRVDALEPGGETSLDVRVTDPNGDGVADAELAVIVVDEAVLSLTGYQLSDPIAALYQGGDRWVQAWRGRSSLLLGDPNFGAAGEGGEDGDFDEAMEEEESFDFAASDDAGDAVSADLAAAPEARALQANVAGATAQEEGAAIELRSNFDALAVFAPEVRTDTDGRAIVEVPLPDNLTRYRIMVVATADATDAGTGESNLTARLPVTVRPTPPRFANFGDVFEFPVVVQNATDEPLDIDVALRATNLAVEGRDGTTVTVPANDRVEVRFEVAADEAGTARYQVAASSGDFSDAAEGEFPVYTPATAEAFATYGVVDSGSISQPLTEPADVWPQFGGLEITTSSTALSALTDAVIYIGDYRYRNAADFSSRIIAITSLGDLLEAFDAADLPSPEALRDRVERDIEELLRLQNGDGGFSWWARTGDSSPYASIHAFHALAIARAEGYEIDDNAFENAAWYVANIEDHYPSWYSQQTRWALSAYALHVRLVAGDRDAGKAERLWRETDDHALDVAAWLWPVLANTDVDAEIERHLANRVTETPNAATFATGFSEQDWLLLRSDRRTDAIVLHALLTERPDSDLTLKTLNGILSSRGRRGHWRNMSENSFVLLAGGLFYETFESVDPDFIARAWLGDTYAVEQPYQGRSTEQNATLVPMSLLVDAGDTDIVLERDGDAGRLYYRLGLRYAPRDFELEPRDQGFVVQRVYEAIDDPDDVVQNDDGTWTVRAGARVRVRVTMVADSRRTHVALIDPMPAGFEAVNPALATSEPTPAVDPSDSAARNSFWWYRWFNHQNLLDDRAEAFASWLGAGSYEYTYVARATTPGTFVVPPARAEQIYEPEVFGRTANTTVQIVDAN